jgi:chemotaxis protein methyltransferase CheR
VQVTREDIQFVAQLVDQLCGVMLDETKGYLVESRLGQLADEHGCTSYRDLCLRARAGGDRVLQQKIIDAITTQETLFFRDSNPFDALQNKILPDLIDDCARSGKARKLRFWSAACSTGQEPYSLAIVLRETFPNFASWNLSILATDISDAAIARASRGWYAAHEIDRGMRASLLPKYFRPHQGGWQVSDEIRGMISFHRRNLLQPFTELGTFDVIFCRNVAIYFDAPRRHALFTRLADQLAPGGTLFVGSSESLMDLGDRFTPRNHCRATYYQPNQQPTPSARPAVVMPVVPTARLGDATRPLVVFPTIRPMVAAPLPPAKAPTVPWSARR